MGGAGEGKSTFITNEVVYNLKNNIPTLVVDTERSLEDYILHLVLHLSGIDIAKYLSNTLNENDVDNLQGWAEYIRLSESFYFSTLSYLHENKLTLESYCQLLMKKVGLKYVFYDQLRAESFNYELMALDNITNEYGLTVVATTSLFS